MIDTPQMVQTQELPTAVIRFRIKRPEMMTVFGPAVQELLEVLKAQGIAPASAVFAYHHSMPPGEFDFEMGFVIDRAVKGSGRVVASTLPATKVARTIYRGGYEGLPGAWGEFTAWMTKEGVKQAESLWELYDKGPQTSPDPSKWETVLHRVVAG
jgi:effector-binding domain-containing protein